MIKILQKKYVNSLLSNRKGNNCALSKVPKLFPRYFMRIRGLAEIFFLHVLSLMSLKV